MGRPSKLSKADIEEAKNLRAAGAKYSEIGEILGESKMVVWKNLSKPEIKAEIEEMQKEFLADNLPVAKMIFDGIIQEGKTVHPQRFRAAERVLESARLLPSMMGAVFIENLNQVNLFQMPMVKEIIGKYTRGLISWDKKEAIDVGEGG